MPLLQKFWMASVNEMSFAIPSLSHRNLLHMAIQDKPECLRESWHGIREAKVPSTAMCFGLCLIPECGN